MNPSPYDSHLLRRPSSMASGMNGLQRSSGAVPGEGPLAAAAYELQPVDPAAELRRLADGTSTPMASTASEAAATVAAVEQPALSPPPPGLDSLRTDMLPSVCQPPLVFVEGKRDGGESAAREVAFPVPIGLTSSPSNVSLAVANKYALMHGETGAEPAGAFGGANVDAGEIRGFGSALAIDMASTSAHHLFVPAGIVDARDSTAKDVLSAAPLPPSSTTVTTSSELLAYSPGRNRRPRSIAEREDAIVEDRPYHQKAPTKGGIAFGKRFVYYSPETGPLQADGFGELKFDGSSEKTPDDGPGLSGTMDIENLLRLPCFWLDVTAPTVSELGLLSSIFRIHPLTVEDIQMDNTREKFEQHRSYFFICYSTVDNDPYSSKYMQPFNVYVLVYAKFVLTFHRSPLSSLPQMLQRMQQLDNYLDNLSPHWINYAILDDITDRFVPLVEAAQSEVDTIDDLVLILSEAEQGDMLRRIANVRKQVMTLQRLMASKIDVLRVLLKRLEGGVLREEPAKTSGISSARDTILYLGDVQDHVITMVQNLSEVSTILSRAHSNYLANITIEITQASNLTNEGMTKLTALASILVPLNIITGLWGMNVNVPGGQAEDGNLVWFFGIVASLILIVIVGFVTVRYMGVAMSKK